MQKYGLVSEKLYRTLKTIDYAHVFLGLELQLLSF